MAEVGLGLSRFIFGSFIRKEGGEREDEVIGRLGRGRRLAFGSSVECILGLQSLTVLLCSLPGRSRIKCGSDSEMMFGV